MAINAINPTTPPAGLIYDKVLVVNKVSSGQIVNGEIKGRLVLTLQRFGYDSNNFAYLDPSGPKTVVITDVFAEAANDPTVFGALLYQEFVGIATFNASRSIV